MPERTPKMNPDSRFSEILALGEASLRKLADSARQLQDAIGGGVIAGVAPAKERTAAQDALATIKTGIYQMRNLFAEARQAGGFPTQGVKSARYCLKKGTGHARKIALQIYPPIRETATTALERSEAYVKANPAKGLLACLGVGLLLGVIIGR